MEPQTLLIGVAGFVLSFLVIYLISVFSMREKTFEEVLEEQRKRQEEEERKAKNERRAEKGERKKYRKFKEKPKEKSSPSPPRETQQPPAATNTKTVVPPVPEVPVVVETVTPTTAAPTEASVKAKSPKSSKKAQKPDTSDTNKLVDSSEKNEKPLVAKSFAPPVRKEDTVEEKNVRQLATQEKNTLNKSNNGKESKTAQKTSPPKQASPVPSTSPAQQQQKQQPPQQQKQQPPQQQKQQPPQQQKQPKKQKQSPQQEQQPSPEQPEPPKQQKQQKQQKQPQQEQKQSKNTINESTNINGQAQQQNTKSKVELKSNTKTSKAAKQNANEALEKQTVNVEQKQKNASSGEENTIKKLSKKEKKAAAAAAAATPTPVAVTTATPVTLTPVENVIVATEEKPVKSQAPKEKKSKKAKSETETSGVTQLISSVKGTTLNDSEIQMLLDVLQSKQNKASQKETVADLLKQLEEKDKKILDVTDGAVKANQTVTELQQQIVNVEKQYDNKIKKLTNENKTLQSQAKKTHLEYEENIASLTNQMKNLESSTVSKEVYDKIVDEVHQLKSAPATPVIDPTEMASMKQKVQIMEKELNNNVLKLNNSEKKKKKFEDKIKEFEAKAKNENKRLEELNLALKNSNNEKALLTEESNKASEALKATQTECASLKSQLEVKELNNKETERNMMNLSKKVEELEEELAIVKQKNQVLLEENKLVHEKPVTVEVNLGERQEPAGAPNGDVQQESLACMKVALVDHEKLIGEKQSEIVRLTTELGNKETEAKARLDEKDSEIQALTTSLNIQVGEVEKLKEEIQVFKTKNDELRKKNWKAMEALENAEKSAVEKVNSAVKNAMDQCQSLDKSVLMRIFPDITVTEPLEQDLWLKTFEAEAIKYVKNLKEVSVSPVKLEKTEMVENELETRLSETEHKLSESEAKCISLNEELQRLTAQISETESVEELHKQIETLTTQLQDSKLKYTELQSNSDETKTELETTFNETKTLCMSLKEKLENASINNSTEENEKQLEALTDQLKESDENVSKLETQVKKYQDLLKVTDDKLQVLQRSVEDEEMKWRRERQTLQKSLSDTQKELEQLKQSQTNQTSTQSSENANSQVELEEKYKVLCLRAEENEKKVRDFSQTIVKLNGIIKTGQDALSQEQEFVRKLKQQLADKNSTGSQSATQEVEEASTVSSNDVGTSV